MSSAWTLGPLPVLDRSPFCMCLPHAPAVQVWELGDRGLLPALILPNLWLLLQTLRCHLEKAKGLSYPIWKRFFQGVGVSPSRDACLLGGRGLQFGTQSHQNRTKQTPQSPGLRSALWGPSWAACSSLGSSHWPLLGRMLRSLCVDRPLCPAALQRGGQQGAGPGSSEGFQHADGPEGCYCCVGSLFGSGSPRLCPVSFQFGLWKLFCF